MQRSLYFLAATTIAIFAYACDGDDGDADPTATFAQTTSQPPPATAGAQTPDPVPTEDLPAIVIAEPALGALVELPFAISGTANVFEAALSVQIVSADGQLICQHNLTATSGSGTRGDWSTTMAFPPPAPPTGNAAVPMVVRALSYSAQHGSEENAVTVDVNVSGERPPNVIQMPLCGEPVPVAGPLQVTGVTDAFEGSLQLELRDSSGAVVLSETVQAAGGLGNAPWSATLQIAGLEAGAYMLIAFDFSAEDGSRQNEFGVPIELTP
ncbi:MAG: Gmad2 immunoglobulin-like domain-containing protein [Dehalococcoidia bacterium]